MSHDDIFNSRYGPRTARGGIKSQSERGKFGKTWWAKRWLGVLEELDLGGRLARGRVYARRGQVLSIDVQEGLVSARVQGSRLHPYDVQIRVKTIPFEKWTLLSKTAFSQAIVAAKLLSADMPEDIEKLFAEHGLSLFPKSMNDFETDCSCPDYSNPCKHIASVYYLLGEEFDRDPFLIFRMRGLPREKLIDLITSVDVAPTSEQDKVEVSSTKKVVKKHKVGRSGAELKRARIEDLPLEDFWKVQSAQHLVGPVHRPSSSAALPKRLGNFSFWRSSYPFMPTLEQIYKIATDNSIRDLSIEPLDCGDAN